MRISRINYGGTAMNGPREERPQDRDNREPSAEERPNSQADLGSLFDKNVEFGAADISGEPLPSIPPTDAEPALPTFPEFSRDSVEDERTDQLAIAEYIENIAGTPARNSIGGPNPIALNAMARLVTLSGTDIAIESPAMESLFTRYAQTGDELVQDRILNAIHAYLFDQLEHIDQPQDQSDGISSRELRDLANAITDGIDAATSDNDEIVTFERQVLSLCREIMERTQ